MSRPELSDTNLKQRLRLLIAPHTKLEPPTVRIVDMLLGLVNSRLEANDYDTQITTNDQPVEEGRISIQNGVTNFTELIQRREELLRGESYALSNPTIHRLHAIVSFFRYIFGVYLGVGPGPCKSDWCVLYFNGITSWESLSSRIRDVTHGRLRIIVRGDLLRLSSKRCRELDAAVVMRRCLRQPEAIHPHCPNEVVSNYFVDYSKVPVESGNPTVLHQEQQQVVREGLEAILRGLAREDRAVLERYDLCTIDRITKEVRRWNQESMYGPSPDGENRRKYFVLVVPYDEFIVCFVPSHTVLLPLDDGHSPSGAVIMSSEKRDAF